MAGRASDFIEAGNQYGIDPGLLVAMAGQEQGFRPYAGNLFGLTQDLGYGDGSATTANDGNRLAKFSDPKNSILAAAKNLRRYADGAYGKPATTVDEIGKLWAADPNWANGVNSYLNRIYG